jgi:ABC-2 type transport system ATP-binding protein
MTTPVIQVEHVTRRFGDVVALDDVSLAVRPGELVGMLGPNGAGKTTLLSLVNGLRKPDSGVVRLFGGDPRSPASRAGLGSTPQETGLPPTLRVAEVVDFVARHYPEPRAVGALLEQFGLTSMARRQTGGLSGGEKRRLAVALALVGNPGLVLLDEPTTGLDVEGRHMLWAALRDYHAAGGTLVLTSHYLEEVQALAERVVVIDRGHVLADDALDAVIGRVAVRRISLTLGSGSGSGSASWSGSQSGSGSGSGSGFGSGSGSGSASWSRLTSVPGGAAASRSMSASTALLGGGLGVLAALPGVVDVREEVGRVELLASDADATVRALVHSGVDFSGLEVRSASLEEAFLSLTASSGSSSAPSAADAPATVDSEEALA